MVAIYFIIFGLFIVVIKYLYINREIKVEQALLEKFYVNEEVMKNSDDMVNLDTEWVDNYIAVLKIPKINLEKGLYEISSPNNNVDKNIQILEGSSMPDVENSNLILASHSGNSLVSYFNNLSKLEVLDEVIIIYKGAEYKYTVINFYLVKKTGKLEIIRNSGKNTLTLITCYGDDLQIVFICELKKY